MKKRILFLTDNFPPEVNAPASRTFDHCSVWIKQGYDVTVITCAPNFPQGKVFAGYRNKLWQVEMMNGIRVIRVWTYIVPNKGFFKRTLDYISFSITGFLAGLFVKTDLIVATSPQFFTALAGRTLAFFKRCRWVMEVRDLWPESIKTVGLVKKDNLFIRYFEWQEMRCYRSAWRIVVVTDAFKRCIANRGIDPAKIFVVKNGVNSDLFHPMPKDDELLNELGLQEKYIIGYIGTHGLAHKLDFIMHCAYELRNDPKIHFLFVGNGAAKESLLDLKRELGLTNVSMIDSVPKEQVNRYISIIDVCLINLRKSSLFETVIPSKIFENAGMGKPILMGVQGEAKEIVEGYGAGVCFEPENAEDFRNKLSFIMTPARYHECVEGCKKLVVDFDRKALANKMINLLMEQ